MNEEQRLREYDHFCKSFEVIAGDESPCRRRFRLVKLAQLYGIARAEFRTLFKVWLAEREGEG